jgi:hypothetical protein
VARQGILIGSLLAGMTAVIGLSSAAWSQANEVTVTVPTASEPAPSVSPGAANVVIPEKPKVEDAAAAVSDRAKAEAATKATETPSEVVKPVKKVTEKKIKPIKPESEQVVTGTTPAGAAEVLPWAAPTPPVTKAATAATDKAAGDTKPKKPGEAEKVVIKCEEQAEDGCRGLPKCAWVADIAQPDGTRIPARCAEKTVFAPPKKKQKTAEKPKPQPKPDAPAAAVTSATPDSPAKPAKPAENAAETATTSSPVTVTPPVEAVVTVPANVEPVKPQ